MLWNVTERICEDRRRIILLVLKHSEILGVESPE